MGQVDGVITGTGHQMPGQQGTKNTHFGGGNPLAKGSQRYDKHQRQKESGKLDMDVCIYATLV